MLSLMLSKLHEIHQVGVTLSNSYVNKDEFNTESVIPIFQSNAIMLNYLPSLQDEALCPKSFP